MKFRTYAEATGDEQLANWIGAHVRAFEFYQGAPKLVVPDNTKTGVTKACRYDPDLNPTYQETAMHYGVGVVPARPYKPRDKAKVESGVLLAERRIIAALRHRKFFSITELNEAIRELQWNWRENQALARRLKSAKLRHNACIEHIDYRAARGLEKTVIRGLAKDSQWVQNHENLFVLGSTGVGKSYIAVPLRRKRAATGTRRSTHGRRRCSGILCWHAPTEVSAPCWRD